MAGLQDITQAKDGAAQTPLEQSPSSWRTRLDARLPAHHQPQAYPERMNLSRSLSRHCFLAATILALARTALACGAGNSTAWPTCPGDSPCPKTGRYYYCQAGKAQNGCQLDKPFPSTDCCSQCVVPAPPATPTCPTAVPCPMDGTNYYSCSSGKAVGGCRKASLGPFPAADCKCQCSFNSANPKYTPPACPSNTIANCPTDGRHFFYCKKTGECRPQSLGWIPNCSAKGDQCLLAPPPSCKCPTSTPCPKDGSAYWYCQAGKAEFGCQKVSKGAFPAADCTLQCRTA